MTIKQKLGMPVHFKKAKFPSNRKIIGRYSYLEPIKINRHANDLFNNYSLDNTNTLWTYMPYGPFKDLLSFKNYLKKKCLNKNPFFYAIYSKRFKSFCGLASYLRIKPEIGTIEVGWITFAPNLQKTVEATEAMYLMMKNAFEVLGNRRYEWKCNNLNSASKNAAKRLGFKFEGVFRQMFVVKGRNRDSAWFSIIDKEWKKLKKGYQRFLEPSNFDKNYIQLKKLKF